MNEEKIIESLKERFSNNLNRHPGILWEDVEKKIRNNHKVTAVLIRMEMTGGEPDVVSIDEYESFTFVDCSVESPTERRKLCYDDEALDERETNKPAASAVAMAREIGIELLSEEQYYKLQEYGEFDTRTSSWVKTPDRIRNLGGAIFCDRRYNAVFTYHNGAESYYSSRGFRGYIRI